MADLGRRLCDEEAGAHLRFSATADPDAAVDGADYALSSVSGSGAEIVRGVQGSYCHSSDMHVSAKQGIQMVIGDTAGPGGLMIGL